MAQKAITKSKKKNSQFAAAPILEGVQPFPDLRQRNTILFDDYNGDWEDINDAYSVDKARSISRWLVSNNGPIRSAVIDIANFSTVGGWCPRFRGENKAWGEVAEEWLKNWFKIYNLSGPSFDIWEDLKLASINMDRDGDCLLVLTYAADGEYPMIQWVPAHRIGSRKDDGTVQGCILNDYGRVIGWKVLGNTEAEDRIVYEQDGALLFESDSIGQIRGLPSVASSILPMRDWRDIVDFERKKAKMLASRGIIVSNKDGGTDAADDMEMETPVNGGVGVYGKYLRGGEMMYVKAGEGEDIKAFEHNNPPQNIQDFLTNHILRSAFAGMNYPVEMYDLSLMKSGPATRLVIGKAMKRVAQRVDTLEYAYLRIIRYAISKAIKLKLLPMDIEFLQWGYDKPAALTIDLGRDVKSSLEEIKMGAGTYADYYGESGKDWREQIDQRIEEQYYIQEKCKEKGLNPQSVQLTTPNAQPVVNGEAEASADDNTEDTKEAS